MVTTSIGAEGMHLKHDKSCLLADSDSDFAAAIDRLYGDEQLWHKVRAEAQKVLEQYFSPATAKKELTKILGSD